MSCLFDLHDDILCTVFLDWIDLQDLVNLDGALCSKSARIAFRAALTSAANRHADSNQVIIKHGGVNLTVAASRNASYLDAMSRWFESRNLVCQHLSLYDCLPLTSLKQLMTSSFSMSSFSIEQTVRFVCPDFVGQVLEVLSAMDQCHRGGNTKRLTLYLKHSATTVFNSSLLPALTQTLPCLEELHLDFYCFAANEIDLLAKAYSSTLKRFTCQWLTPDAFKEFFLTHHFSALECFSITRDCPYDSLGFISRDKERLVHMNSSDFTVSVERAFIDSVATRSLPHMREIRCTDIFTVKLITYLTPQLQTLGMYFGGSAMVLYPEQLEAIIPSIGVATSPALRCLQFDFNDSSGIFRRQRGFAYDGLLLHSFHAVTSIAIVTSDWTPADKVIGRLLLEIPECCRLLTDFHFQLLDQSTTINVAVQSQLKHFFAKVATYCLALQSLQLENVPLFGNYLLGDARLGNENEDTEVTEAVSDATTTEAPGTDTLAMESILTKSLKTLVLVAPRQTLCFEDHIFPLHRVQPLLKIRLSYGAWRSSDILRLFGEGTVLRFPQLRMLRLDPPIIRSYTQFDLSWTFALIHRLLAGLPKVSRLALPIWNDFDLLHPEIIVDTLQRLQNLWIITLQSTSFGEVESPWESAWIKYIFSKKDDPISSFQRVLPIVDSELTPAMADKFL